jgi:MFS family permease
VTDTQASPIAAPPRPRSALRHPGYRIFFIGTVLAFTADSVEHVISYWMIFQKFHSSILSGFAVVSHWLPFLLFSVLVGALGDRFDPRRIIQAGMLCFMAASCAWGYFFLTDTLQMWEAVAILVIHGLAGVLWMPSTQLLIHDIVEPELLPSAVRLNATARWIGFLGGPMVGTALQQALGSSFGIFANTLIYLPMFVWLIGAPYGPRFRKGGKVVQPAIRGFADIMTAIHAVAANRVLLAMTLLAGSMSSLIGTAYQPQMPAFARDLGHGAAGVAYGALLTADAIGAVVAAIILESTNLLAPRARTTEILALLWALTIISFTLATNYEVALVCLFFAGFFELSFNSMAQTLVQLNAPAAIRGRVIGLYTMAALGLRCISGVTVGFGGELIGVHWSLGICAGLAGIIMLLLFAFSGQKPAVQVQGTG